MKGFSRMMRILGSSESGELWNPALARGCIGACAHERQNLSSEVQVL